MVAPVVLALAIAFICGALAADPAETVHGTITLHKRNAEPGVVMTLLGGESVRSSQKLRSYHECDAGCLLLTRGRRSVPEPSAPTSAQKRGFVNTNMKVVDLPLDDISIPELKRQARAGPLDEQIITLLALGRRR